MRIALAGFSIESSTFTPLVTRGADFSVLHGADLLKTYPFLGNFPDVKPVPLLWARSLPGGPVERSFYEDIKTELVEMLTTGAPWDGVFLHMHGAANAVGLQDLEGDLYAAVRAAVGTECLLAASYDLHGSLSQRAAKTLDLLSAYRTAPHIDGAETVKRAFGLLVKCLRLGIRPCKAWVRVPILLPGEQTSTNWEPAASLYAAIPGIIHPDAVMDASILIGYLWADEPRSAAAVTAYGLDQAAVDAAVRTLAQRFWDVRKQFRFGVEALPVDECIHRALAAEEAPVVISDSGDNPTAGGAGDTPFVLERLLAQGVPDAVFASISDPAAVGQCRMAGVGGKVHCLLGGKLDPVNASPLAVDGLVVSRSEQPWPPYSVQPSRNNRCAVMQVEGVQVILTSLRTPFHRIRDFQAQGIQPAEHKIVVVKIGYLEPELQLLAKKALLALSPGGVNQDIRGLPFHSLSRPLFPFDVEMEWVL